MAAQATASAMCLGQTALIIGGGSGIGRAAAVAMADAGASVFAADLVLEKAQETVALLSQDHAASGQVDISCRESLLQLRNEVEAHFEGAPDCVIFSAGRWMDYTPLVGCSEAVWNEMMQVNLTSHFHFAQAFLPSMMKRKRGSVVFVSSISGRTGGTGGTIPYAVAKGGVNALMRGLAHEMAPYGIRVNAIAPGLVDTPLLNRPANQKRTEEWISRIPLGRMARPDELTGAILLLASDAGSYITGELIEINGGILMN